MSAPQEPAEDRSDIDEIDSDFDRDEETVVVEKDDDVGMLEEDLTVLMNSAKDLMTSINDSQQTKISDAETASVLLVELARVNSHLAKKAAYAKYIARNMGEVYKQAKDEAEVSAVKRLGISATAAKNFRHTDTIQQRDLWSKCLWIAEESVDFGFRVDTFLDLARTRISLIKDDIKRG